MGRFTLCLLITLMSTCLLVHANDRAIGVQGIVPLAIRASEGFDPAESAGLFVGIRAFKDEGFAEVPFAVDDAIDLAHLFALELDLVAPENVTLALAGDPQKPTSAARLQALLQAGAIHASASKFQILRHLKKCRLATGKRGLFVVAFATHGFNHQGRDFLVGADTVHDFIQDTGIKVDIVFDQAAQASAPRRLVLLDTCREHLSKGRRWRGLNPESAMSEAFANAIAQASGQVVLLGTTMGGYSYDDYELKNGVFTASILDGLRGQAPADQRHFITARTLSDYIDHRVRHWVRDHRPEHATISTGISRRFEGPAATMPLAIDLAAMQASAAKSGQERYEAALQKLYANVDFRGPITGRLADEIAQVLSSDLAADRREALLSELETLDGSLRGKRIFADSYHQRRQQFGFGNGTKQSHQKTSAPLLSPPIPQGEVSIATLPSQPAAYTLTVRADPPDSRIRVMNIRPSYKPEMSLPPGAYDILVDHEGYNPARQWVTIRDQDIVIDMRLDQHQALPLVQTDMTSEPSLASGPNVAVGTYTPPGEITNSIGMQFVRIAPGAFQMGSTASGAGEDEQPVHTVEIMQAFYLGKYEVTQSQWEVVMGHNPSQHKGDDHPVVRVSWADVQVFIRNLNAREGDSVYRLPTEAEWEYATRSGSQTAYGFGNSSHQLNQYAWYGENAEGQPHPVGQLKANSWGLHDLHGNVWEWLQDWYGATYYQESPHRNPQGPSSGSHRVVRGGSWSSGARNCHSASRGHWPPDFRSDYVGFRLLRAVQ